MAMNKDGLVREYVSVLEEQDVKVSLKDAKVQVDAFFTAITNGLLSEQKVGVVGFGTFEVRERNARTGRNPQTGEEIEIPATKSPAFKPGKALKDAVKGS